MTPNYDEKYVAHLFDQMGPSYDVMNLITSFGFSEVWRAQCVGNLKITKGAVVADLMAGSGECWTYLRRRLRGTGKILSVDISPVMCRRQKARLGCAGSPVDIRCENALAMSLADGSVDHVISGFGLKTFNADQLNRLAAETFRILRPGGSCSFIEISVPEARLLQMLYGWYISSVIPLVGKAFLGGIDCYQMLGIYTAAFGSCAGCADIFRNAGFAVTVKKHFFGCATSLVLVKK
ncbi:MAG: class I SAM-dependent methyltransferase [Verrucomicrobiae bacterium]|nr:class I SAM-dependent methyltransferase [Verrucomicrobiae bacterium]